MTIDTIVEDRLKNRLINKVLIASAVLAFGFCLGELKAPFSMDLLIRNGFHWFVFLSCVAFLFVVSCQTIHNYRSSMAELVTEISAHRDELANANTELTDALNNVKTLKGMLPICASCKKIRDDKGYWNQIETYIQERSEADFSHGICPSCLKRLYPEEYRLLESSEKE